MTDRLAAFVKYPRIVERGDEPSTVDRLNAVSVSIIAAGSDIEAAIHELGKCVTDSEVMAHEIQGKRDRLAKLAKWLEDDRAQIDNLSQRIVARAERYAERDGAE